MTLLVLLSLPVLPLLALLQLPPELSFDVTQVAASAFQAVASGNWGPAAALGVVLLVLLARPLLAARVPFFATVRGTAVLLLVTAVAGGLANALLAGTVLGLPLLAQVGSVVLMAGGGYLVKAIFFGENALAAADAKGGLLNIGQPFTSAPAAPLSPSAALAQLPVGSLGNTAAPHLQKALDALPRGK